MAIRTWRFSIEYSFSIITSIFINHGSIDFWTLTSDEASALIERYSVGEQVDEESLALTAGH